ncbi:MAG: carotenoid oxygenase family protein [Alphaproteobacteria bacterium]|nr:carotenoid oxygenase family protein [Alphaproteobacteria bacterium]
MNPSRRALLGGGLAAGALLAIAPRSFGEARQPAWSAGFRNAPAAGYDPGAMRLVAGKAPRGLVGSLYRNGPAQLHYGTANASHWFDGDGMIHRIRLQDGNAVHSGRFVATPKRRAEQAAGKFLAPGFGSLGDPSFSVENPDDVNAANTSVIRIGDELLALWEGGSAYRLDPVTLETRGPKTWRSDLKGMPFLAHPKREPDGRVWNLGQSGRRVGIYRIGADGGLEDFGLVDIGAPAYIHDWTMTERKLIILVQPWLHTREIPPFVDGLEWKPEEGMKVLVIDKDDLTKNRWVQAPPRTFYHTGAAWEDGDAIRLDVAFYKSPVLGSGGGAEWFAGRYNEGAYPVGDLTLMEIPAAGDARLIETGINGDFPQVDPRRHVLNRHLVALVTGEAPGRPAATALTVHDWKTGKTQVHDFGAGHMVEEHLFVPKPGGAGERDSWLVGTALNIREGASEINLFETADVSAGPVATWRADYAWPLGFHGAWSRL